MNINKSKILITGGTNGIGFEIAKTLSAEGAEVVVCGQNQARIDKTIKKIGVHGIRADVSQEEDVTSLFAEAIELMNGLDVLINNAGEGGNFRTLVDSSAEELQKIWEVNVKGLFLCGQEAARYFIDQNYGNIINIGSSAATKGFAGGSIYCSSKFAVSGLTQCWQAELRPHNIRVMQINPSEVITDFGGTLGIESKNAEKKLKPSDIAHLAKSMLSMDDVGFIPAASVWATNPW